MSAFLHQESAQHTHSISSTSLKSSLLRRSQNTEEDTAEEAARHNACNVCLWVHHIPSISSNHGLFGYMFCEEPCHKAKASSRIEVHLFCSVPYQQKSKPLLADPTQNLSLPNMSFLHESEKKEGDDNYSHWCVKTGHTRTITDYNCTLYALALKAQAMSSLER